MSIPTLKINLTVAYSKEAGFSFNYENCEGGTVVVSQACYLEYNLIDKTDFDLSFAGVAFSDPFNNVITRVDLKKNTVTLMDPFSCNDKEVSFEFGFNIGHSPNGEDKHGLLLLSADPQVINRDPGCPPPVA